VTAAASPHRFPAFEIKKTSGRNAEGRYTLRDPNASDALARTAPKPSAEDGVMMTPTRIVRMIGIAGLVGWMGMVGWVAKTTQAQNGGQNPPALPPAATKPDDLPQAGQETPKAMDAPAPLPAAPDSGAGLASEK